MTATLSGPMFDPAQTPDWRSIFGKEGGHYNVRATTSEGAGMRILRKWFGGYPVNELCFVLFSTSGVHGTYVTIEEAEKSWVKRQAGEESTDDDCYPEVTFLIVQPRIVQLLYGNCKPETAEDWALLRRLRQESWDAVRKIGAPEE